MSCRWSRCCRCRRRCVSRSPGAGPSVADPARRPVPPDNRRPPPTPGGIRYERRLVGRNPPPRRDRQALRLGDRAAAALLAAHGGRCPEIAAAAGLANRAQRVSLLDPYRDQRSSSCWPGIPTSRPGAHPRGDRPRTAGLYRQAASILRRYYAAGLSRPAAVSTRRCLTHRPRPCKSIGVNAAAWCRLARPAPQGLGVRGRALL